MKTQKPMNFEEGNLNTNKNKMEKLKNRQLGQFWV